MNGWLKAAPHIYRTPKRFSTRHLGPFVQRRGLAEVAPRTRLSDLLASPRVAGVEEPPFTRRAVSVTNLPPGLNLQDILDRVDSGPLEYIKLFPESRRAELSFLYGHSATRFFAAKPLFINDCPLTWTWLPHRPLDPDIAVAVESKRARRVLLLFNSYDAADFWTADRLQTYFEGVEKITQPETPGAALAAVVYFTDISSAIRAHGKIRADSTLAGVRVAYGMDRCEIPRAHRFDDAINVEAALKSKPPPVPTSLPLDPESGQPQPFTTLTISNLHEGTNIRDLCKRIFGGPIYSINLHQNCTADVTFFHPEQASRFYTRHCANGLTIHGRKLKIEAQPERAPPTIRERGYSRVLRIRAFHPHRKSLVHQTLREHFGLFGPLEHVGVDPRYHGSARISFARATDAARALKRLPVIRPEYKTYHMRFGVDPCARLFERARAPERRLTAKAKSEPKSEAVQTEIGTRPDADADADAVPGLMDVLTRAEAEREATRVAATLVSELVESATHGRRHRFLRVAAPRPRHRVLLPVSEGQAGYEAWRLSPMPVLAPKKPTLRGMRRWVEEGRRWVQEGQRARWEALKALRAAQMRSGGGDELGYVDSPNPGHNRRAAYDERMKRAQQGRQVPRS
ncbi:hypothetical protein C8F04DRAFT_1060044 [Mycena alexandri]|uniref:RRM domain-containing protein n=1 Tax=Mycena alexandri TaxID=1745969 RepID=A0AAD6XF70_9AGAR|nr:hypothetical protein C8F04DRAFT_1060044 [Mycena alexandri]